MTGVDVFIFAAVGVGICFAAYNFAVIQRTKVNPGRTYQPANSPLIAVQAELAKVEQIHATIDTGAKAFLRAEYTICVQFLLAFSVLLLILTTVGSSFAEGLFTTVAFLVGGCVEINQCVGCTRQFFTKSFLGDDAADVARSSGEEPASPRHRAGVASMAWRTTR